MPASYVHQCIAGASCDALSLFREPQLRHAVLAGSEGPDPLFFSLLSPRVVRLGLTLHTRRTDDFLLALCDSCARSAITRAYCCGFFAHYAADTVLHPFIYAHAVSGGVYSSMAHCALEHQLETLHYRRQGHETGLPEQMEGFAHLGRADKDAIACALSAAIHSVFPGEPIRTEAVRKCFEHSVRICRLLLPEHGGKRSPACALLRPFRLLAPLRAHMMPADQPPGDITNDSHRPWASIWAPETIRTEGFDDLFAAAVLRAGELISAANACMLGNGSYASLRALHGGLSYASGLPWQATCPARQAPGVSVRQA